MKTHLIQAMRLLRHHKKYIYYSMIYGLSSLILPMGTQFLVNNLALSGIWFNTLSFLFIIGIGLCFSQVIKHSQVILGEALQREIFVIEIEKWKNFKNPSLSHIYFEIPGLLKSFSKAYSHLIELGLLVIFGLSTILLFHPAFILLPVIIGLTTYQIFQTFNPSIESSIEESNKKYELYEIISSGNEICHSDINSYLLARDDHFNFTKKNSFKVSALTVFCQILLLGSGSYLIQLEQLSVGQLVSAEIIITGIFISLLKLPQTLEAIFDYETSKYKIIKALAGK
jgi:hypothetical protein